MIVARNHCDYDHINPDDGAGECDGFKNKEASAIYLYRLKDSSRNILKNADFWIPAPYDTYWKQYQSAMAIYRNYTLSSDGNQAMEFNCGAACQDGASIYQEVDVSAHPKESFTFGGKFRVAHDGVGELQVAVHQLRADGSLGYRCAAEPEADYVRKQGDPAALAGRKCLCNGLIATAGLAQIRADGTAEPPILTAGNDIAQLGRFLPSDAESYTAADVIRHVLG